ncbi:hypothetical protein MBRA1_001277 [Malassezia brasiliensis]|uniref:Amino acid permease/ SLC12A domain-containing protein n=1 Tax=Malassezia brasiliensis TaxID=1821822 RepID=A0AAF0DSI4_9BASI|nr:hypothetical protein MBRA1_001277 [Malassezia brasiliensis]
MSRFVSAGEADYESLEQKLLERQPFEESGDAPRAQPGTFDAQDADLEAQASPTTSSPESVRKSSRATRISRPASHRRNSDVDAAPPARAPDHRTADGGGDGNHSTAVGRRVSGMASHGAEGVPRKLGTWDGVFMPVTLNVLGIILFLRFGFILGQAGLLGSLLLLVLSYGVDTLTVLSLNAISTNGQVRGGGAYYLISRSLGPEFGGSIGLVFFFGQAFNAAMNVLGCVESLVGAIGVSRGGHGFLPEGSWYLYLYGTLVLWISTLVCLFGSSLFSRATLMLAVVLSLAVISIPVSALVVPPFEDAARDVYYSSWSWTTFSENLWPHFTANAAGSSTAPARESWRSVFGVLFPAVCGILAGASMSGDLRKPSKSIPKGTNWSLVFTFALYVFAFVIMAATIPRESLYRNVGIVGDVALWPAVVVFGELASCAFSALMGVMACAKVLQAIARDDLLPLLTVFAQGTARGDVPVAALFATALVCQLVLMLDSINLIAQLVTMTTLLTFAVLCAATFALKAGGAPSFRPSFRYWNIWTAGAGTVVSFGAMLFADAYVALVCVVVTALLFITIQVFCPPKPWGDVSHNVTYHFVRKYLLRLDERKGHVKYWRPQILLLANNPRHEWNLIIFCNSLKKGALYVLGHVLKGDFQRCLPELRQQHLAWLKLVDVSGVKSFVDVVIARDEREGARNLILSCGLGGMRPNIIVLGFPAELQRARTVPRTMPGAPSGSASAATPLLSDLRALPTDTARKETPIRPETFVGILEDALALNKALAVAYGFDSMCLPGPSKVAHYRHGDAERYIDLWPIQIATHAASEAPTWDTYTMVLQLGTILSFTGTWSRHKLRVSVFVEHAEEVASERGRVRTLLDNLRIPAALRVFCLSSGAVPRYDAIVRGKRALDPEVSEALRDDPWWTHVCAARAAQQAAAQRRSEPIDLARRDAGEASGTPGGYGRPSKRSQRLFGVSLPEEHLAYHYNNIRIGLAHPRSHSTAEDDGESESDIDAPEDTYDELESELARLAVDWDPKYLMRGRRPPRDRGQGELSGTPTYGTLSSSQQTVTLSRVRSSRSTPPPPSSAGSDAYVENTPRRSSVLRGAVRPSVEAPNAAPHDAYSNASSPVSSRATSRSASRSASRGAPMVTPAAVAASGDAFQLSFNELPNLAQYLILNELIRTNSDASTSVLLTALPAPEPGTSTSHEQSTTYLQQLQRLYGGGPPVMGVHATTLTMTMSL